MNGFSLSKRDMWDITQYAKGVTLSKSDIIPYTYGFTLSKSDITPYTNDAVPVLSPISLAVQARLEIASIKHGGFLVLYFEI